MTFLYLSQYDSTDLRGKDGEERPWNLVTEIINHTPPQSTLLDIGCGTAFKLIHLSRHFSEIIGIDISKDMLQSASNLMKKEKIRNIKFLHGDSHYLPFDDNTFDSVTCMLSTWDVEEIVRVLKPNGNVIVEHIGCEDKKDFKMYFGKDMDGWRGQFINFKTDDYIQNYYELFRRYFETVSITNGFWKTHYTESGLLELLKQTPTIRNFNLTADSEILKNASQAFRCQQGIELIQNRILIHAKNIRNF